MNSNSVSVVDTAGVMTFAEQLRKLRTEKGYTQAEAAKALGVGRTIYVQWEHDLLPAKLKRYGALAILRELKPKSKIKTNRQASKPQADVRREEIDHAKRAEADHAERLAVFRRTMGQAAARRLARTRQK